MIILGAGLAGCIAGHLFPGSTLYEAGEEGCYGKHRALLRFRSDALSRVTGVPFRKVRVYKAVCEGGNVWTSSVPLRLMNMYAEKVTGTISPRSLRSPLEPVERWIAPENFHALLIARLTVVYNFKIGHINRMAFWSPGLNLGVDRLDIPLLNTIPLPDLLSFAGVDHSVIFRRLPIFVRRYKVPNCDVHQTVYFPGSDVKPYRASITGDILIVEAMRAFNDARDLDDVREAFGLEGKELALQDNSSQQYGKIMPIEDELRQSILLRLTQELNIYSFGRFGTWRNVLLDDLPHDAKRINGLLRMNAYQQQLSSARKNEEKK